MFIDDLPVAHSEALHRALRYWDAHWDWEYATLFGLPQADFSAVAGAWPQSVAGRPHVSALAIDGAMREILFGASSPRSIADTLGISSDEASTLLQQLQPRIRNVLR